MKLNRLLPLIAALMLALPGAVHSVTFDWILVGAPGNACDVQSQGCFGAVATDYVISKFEVSNAQYAELLNAAAADDPNGLYDPMMDSSSDGGITQSGSAGSFVYTLKPGFADKPVNFVTFFDAQRFANWLDNGQPTGTQDATTTEDGAYTLPGDPLNGAPRNVGAAIFLPTEDEWYKAAYYDPSSDSYFDYPAGSDTPTACALPSATPNTANCASQVGGSSEVGAYTGSPSPVGTFDQGGNVAEWADTLPSGALLSRVARASAFPLPQVRLLISRFSLPRTFVVRSLR
jgi:formylglycine-generating enzyme required for sulfatase activity